MFIRSLWPNLSPEVQFSVLLQEIVGLLFLKLWLLLGKIVELRMKDLQNDSEIDTTVL